MSNVAPVQLSARNDYLDIEGYGTNNMFCKQTHMNLSPDSLLWPNIKQKIILVNTVPEHAILPWNVLAL